MGRKTLILSLFSSMSAAQMAPVPGGGSLNTHAAADPDKFHTTPAPEAGDLHQVGSTLFGLLRGYLQSEMAAEIDVDTYVACLMALATLMALRCGSCILLNSGYRLAQKYHGLQPWLKRVSSLRQFAFGDQGTRAEEENFRALAKDVQLHRLTQLQLRELRIFAGHLLGETQPGPSSRKRNRQEEQPTDSGHSTGTTEHTMSFTPPPAPAVAVTQMPRPALKADRLDAGDSQHARRTFMAGRTPYNFPSLDADTARAIRQNISDARRVLESSRSPAEYSLPGSLPTSTPTQESTASGRSADLRRINQEFSPFRTAAHAVRDHPAAEATGYAGDVRKRVSFFDKQGRK